MRDVVYGQRADFQPAFGAAGATVVEPVQPVSLLAALGNERGILWRDQFVRWRQNRLNRFRVILSHGKLLSNWRAYVRSE